MSVEIYCPVCKSESKVLYDLEPGYLKENLEKYFKTDIKQNIGLIHYKMVQCSNCTLTFAHPLQEGSNSFYSWITMQEDYYPKDRWEYHKVYDILKRHKSENVSLLDVGCGSGEFLESLKSLTAVKTVGVDTTLTSIETCKKKKLEGYCMDLDQFLSENSQYRNYFDYVVSFHCLEHIGNPVGFLKSMLQAMKTGGSIFISTPYSPMSFEVDWFDPLNHPPHHMGRWNARSYRELGKQLNLSVDFYMPASLSALKRASVAFFYSKVGSAENFTKLKLMMLVLKNPFSFYRHIVKQRLREDIKGQVAADVVLVEFKKKQST